MAKRMRIPIYHMEAGNRCFDENVPEETNRRLVDHVADFNLVYTEHARRNLLAEGLHPRRDLLTGSPMREVLEHFRAADRCLRRPRPARADAGQYFLVSAHREENVDSPARLRTLLDCLTARARAWQLPVVVSTHPRTRKRLEALAGRRRAAGQVAGAVRLPRLQPAAAGGRLRALGLRHDRGGIHDARVPCDHAPRLHRASEALDTGSIMMTGLEVSERPYTLSTSAYATSSIRRSWRPKRPQSIRSAIHPNGPSGSYCPRRTGTGPGPGSEIDVNLFYAPPVSQARQSV